MKTKMLSVLMILLALMAAPCALSGLYGRGWPMFPAWVWVGFWGAWLVVVCRIHVSKFLYLGLLAMCIPAYAALPPSPIARPAPLLSPKAASAPKATPMLKASTFTQASTGGPLMLPVVRTYDINLNACDTNDPNCITFDLVNGSGVQLRGYDMSIQFTHSLGSGQWTELAWFGAGPEDRISEFNWFRPKWQRPTGEFFRSASTLAPTTGTTASMVIAPAVRVNSALPGSITVTTRKK